MKSIRLLAILTILLGFTYRGLSIVTPTAVGPVNFKFVATLQGEEVNGGKTNSTSSVTNLTATIKIPTSNLALNNAKLLQMLENSYNTTFPAGAALKIDQNTSIVVAIGTNIIQTVTNILSLTTSNLNVASGSVNVKQKTASSGTTEQFSENISELIPASLNYDDSAFTTADGSTTRFSAKGLETLHFTVKSADASNQKANFMINFSGAGGGTIVNGASTTNLVLKGSALGSFTVTQPVGP